MPFSQRSMSTVSLVGFFSRRARTVSPFSPNLFLTS